MPQFENEVLIDAPLARVYDLAKDVESFPQFMPDVESVVVTERSDDGNRTVTNWVGVAKDFKLKIRWTEEDIWNPIARTCTFTLVKGDYQEYGGVWTFTEEPGGKTKFASTLNYEIEIPLIGPLIKKVVAKLMRENTQGILEAIKTRAESS